MSYRLFLFVGHFAHDGNFAAIQINKSANAALPKVNQPLDVRDVQRSAVEFCCGDARRVGNWDITIENNHITFCEFSDSKALAWILELARTRNVDVIEGGTMRVVPLTELSSMAASPA